RQKLASLGVDEVHYEAGKDLSVYYKQPALQACESDPSIKTESVPLAQNESYLLLLRMAMEPGNKGQWAKDQLDALHQGGRSLLLTNPNAEAWREIVNQAMVRDINNDAQVDKGGTDLTDWESRPAKKDFIDKYLVDPLIELFTGEKQGPKTQRQQVLEAQFYGMQVEQQFILSDLVSEFESTLRGAASADRISEVLGVGTLNPKIGSNKNCQIESPGGINGSGFGKIKALGDVDTVSGTKPLLDEFNPVIKGVGGTGESKRFTGSGMKDYDGAAEAEYAAIRNVNMRDIEELARNTGLSVNEIKTMKKHLFFGKHQLPQPGGIEFKLERFAADDEIAYAWKTAQNGELSIEQKAWFKQLAAHELTERQFMAEGQKYRTLESWNIEKGRFDGYPPGAHENAPSQPNWTFPGYEEYYFKNLFK
ncbi:hypothetical protein QW71_35960, partial [Paenibacillus sp. IHB B 3415]